MTLYTRQFRPLCPYMHTPYKGGLKSTSDGDSVLWTLIPTIVIGGILFALALICSWKIIGHITMIVSVATCQ